MVYIVEEAIHVIKCVYDPGTPWYEYFVRPGTAPHMLNLFLFLVVYGMGYAARLSMPKKIDPSGNEYVSLWSPGNWFQGAKAMASFNVLLTWLKIFRYIGFVPVFAQISRTLEASFRACFGFIVVIVLVGFAVASAFLLAFGTRIEGFRNLTEAASSVFMGFMGDINLSELRAANYWLGPILFIIFLLLGIFVLLNMFIAIIGEAYSSTKDDMRREALARKLARDPSAQDLIQLYMKHVLFTLKPPAQLAAALNAAALKKKMLTQMMSSRLTPGAGPGAGAGGVMGGMMAGVTGALRLRRVFVGGNGGGDKKMPSDDSLAGDQSSEAERLRQAGARGKGPGEANVKGSGGQGDAAAPVAVDVPSELDKDEPPGGTSAAAAVVMPFTPRVKLGPFGLPLESTGVGFNTNKKSKNGRDVNNDANADAAAAAAAVDAAPAHGAQRDDDVSYTGAVDEGGGISDAVAAFLAVTSGAEGMMVEEGNRVGGIGVGGVGGGSGGVVSVYDLESGMGGVGGGIDLVNGRGFTSKHTIVPDASTQLFPSLFSMFTFPRY